MREGGKEAHIGSTMGQHNRMAERSPHQRHYKQSGRDVRQYQSAHRRNRRQRGDNAAGMERQRVFDDTKPFGNCHRPHRRSDSGLRDDAGADPAYHRKEQSS